MFGLSAEEAERARRKGARRRRVKAWRMRPVRVIVLLLLGAMAALPLAVVWTLNRPREIQGWMDHFTAGAPIRMLLEDVVFLPVGVWHDPWSWRLAVTGLAMTNTDPKKPTWRVDRGTLPLPMPRRVQGGRWWLHWTSLEVDGLLIEAHQQRPPPPWEPAHPPIARLTADTVRVRRAEYSAPEDPPLGSAHMEDIRGDLVELVYDPGRREVSAHGTIRASRFTTGAVQVQDIEAPVFALEQSSLRFDGTFQFANTPGTINGTIHTFHVKPRVALHATITDANISDVVYTATGRDSPVGGRLDLDLSIAAGGERPRGCARMTGEVALRQGRIKLSPSTRYLILDLIRVAPWVTLNAYKEIELHDANGRVTLTRGTFTLRDLRYPAGRQPIRLDGTIGSDSLWLLVRLIPRVAPTERVGLAVAVEGQRGGQKVRLATRDDVFRERPWLAPAWDAQGGVPGTLPCGQWTVE